MPETPNHAASPSPLEAALWQQGRQHVLYAPALLPAPSLALFEPAHWQAQGGVLARFTGRGQALLVQQGAAQWVLRPYLRGGLVAKISRDAYWWTGLEATRPWQEWRLTAALHAQGLPVPRPVAARVQRQGLFYRGDLITEFLPGTRPFCDVLAAGQAQPVHWQRLGQVLRQLRDAGVHHPDLNVRNVLLNADGEVFVIDFDKARLGSTAAQFMQDVARFKRSIDKFQASQPTPCVREADWQILLAAVQA